METRYFKILPLGEEKPTVLFRRVSDGRRLRYERLEPDGTWREENDLASGVWFRDLATKEIPESQAAQVAAGLYAVLVKPPLPFAA